MTSDHTPGSMGHILVASQSALVMVLILGVGFLARHVLDRKPTATRPFALGALCLALIAAVLAFAIEILTHGSIVGVDAAVARWLFAHRTDWLDQAMMLISALGDGLERTVGTIVLAAYLLWRRRLRWALALATVMIAAAVLTSVLKTVFHFARPSLLYSGAEAFSFPSGHATSAAALYIVLAWIAARPPSRSYRAIAWGLAATMIVLTGLSRIYVGAHWFSDVLAGFALGGALGVAGVILASGGRGAPVDGNRRDGVALLLILVVVGMVLGPAASSKAHRLYQPYLARPVEKIVDPGHLGATGRAPT